MHFSAGSLTHRPLSRRNRLGLVVVVIIAALAVDFPCEIESAVTTTTTTDFSTITADTIPNPTAPSTTDPTTTSTEESSSGEEKKSDSRQRKLSQLRMAAQLNGSNHNPSLSSPVNISGDSSSDKSPTRANNFHFSSLSSSSADNTSMETCFAAFDIDRDGHLDSAEFAELCRALFRNEQDNPYPLEEKRVHELFEIFDIDKDGRIDAKEFDICWQKWIRKIVRPVSALIVVDVQNDFISGSLAISNCPAQQNGEEVVEPINRLLDTVEFDCVYYSLDWHPDNHVSFIDNVMLRKLHNSSEIKDPKDAKSYDTVVFDGRPPFRQKLWPRHCVQNSWGAKLHENLKVVEGSPFIYKGTNPELDSYSAFFDNSKLSATALVTELRDKGVTDCYVCGIALDVCVGATATHSQELGYRTILIADASRGITVEDIEETKQKIIDGHGAVIDSHEVKSMVQGRDRRPELGYKLALELRKQIKEIENSDRS